MYKRPSGASTRLELRHGLAIVADVPEYVVTEDDLELLSSDGIAVMSTRVTSGLRGSSSLRASRATARRQASRTRSAALRVVLSILAQY
jgi:hypothetical protein